jgi:hypothetical protein
MVLGVDLLQEADYVEQTLQYYTEISRGCEADHLPSELS